MKLQRSLELLLFAACLAALIFTVRAQRAEVPEFELPIESLNAVARVQTVERDRWGIEYRSSGSAVAITPHTLLTCAHVVMDAEAITVELPGDDGYTELQATVERLDLEADLAILRVEERLPATVVIGLTRSLALHGGEAVYAQGAALGYSPRGLARGYFASREGDENLLMGACWTARISTAPGSSGGAIFDPRTGFLLGIVRGGLSSGQVCFFIPAPRIVEFIDAWH